MATAGTLVTVTHGVQDHKAGGLTYGRVGVIYFVHTHACERDREGEKRCVGINCFAHT